MRGALVNEVGDAGAVTESRVVDDCAATGMTGREEGRATGLVTDRRVLGQLAVAGYIARRSQVRSVDGTNLDNKFLSAFCISFTLLLGQKLI